MSLKGGKPPLAVTLENYRKALEADIALKRAYVPHLDPVQSEEPTIGESIFPLVPSSPSI